MGWGPGRTSSALICKRDASGSWISKPGSHPQKLGIPGLRVAEFRAGGQSLENSKEALCFQGRRQGKGHHPLPDERVAPEWPLSNPSLPGQGARGRWGQSHSPLPHCPLPTVFELPGLSTTCVWSR